MLIPIGFELSRIRPELGHSRRRSDGYIGARLEQQRARARATNEAPQADPSRCLLAAGCGSQDVSVLFPSGVARTIDNPRSSPQAARSKFNVWCWCTLRIPRVARRNSNQ